MSTYTSGIGYRPSVPSERFAAVNWKYYGGRTRPVIGCHPNATTGQIMAQVSVETVPFVRRCTERGLLMHCGDLAGTSQYGSTDSQAAITDATADVEARYSTPEDGFLIFGMSGGTQDSLNWAYANADQIAAMAIVLPVPDLQDAYVNRGFAANINAVYGGAAAWAAAEPTHNPAHAGRQAPLSVIPAIKVWHPDDDPVSPLSVTMAWVAQMEAAGCNIETVSMGNVGHTAVNLDPEEVAEFLLAHA